MLKKDEMKNWIILILISMSAYWLVTNINIILGILSKTINVLSPFILSIVISFILNIPMTKIEKGLKKIIKNKNFPTRIVSIVISLVLFILVIAFVLFLLIPEVISSIESLITSLPVIINNLESKLINLLDKSPDIQKQISQIFATNSIETMLPNVLTYVINSSLTLVTNLVNSIITTFTAIVFSFYILCQKETIIKGSKKILRAYLNKDLANRIIEIGKLSNQTFSKFISGQCLEAVILGIIMFIAFTIFNFPYALLIAVLTSVTALIPIFGALIAMVIGALLIATVSPLQSVIFLGVFLVIQQIEGNIIYPKVVGKSVGLSPMWTLFAIMLGGNLFGVVGMLTFLPLASILYALLKDDIIKKINTPKESITK